MKAVAIIPARFSSSRFPGKPLIKIGSRTMIQRVYEQVKSLPSLSDVIVATDDTRIEQHVQSFGGKVMMTHATHRSGTE
ncbi:MAG: cytidylyltransferase domain-containing protein, partial [Candidatus Saccharimonadales bacterium]